MPSNTIYCQRNVSNVESVVDCFDAIFPKCVLRFIHSVMDRSILDKVLCLCATQIGFDLEKRPKKVFICGSETNMLLKI